MKKVFNWLFISMLMVVLLPITSCGDDDYKVPEPEKLTASTLIGTWERDTKYQSIEKATIDEANSLYQFTEITFADKGIATAETEEGGEVSGTWSLSGDKLTLKLGDFSVVCSTKRIGHTDTNISFTYAVTGTMPDTTDAEGNVVPGEKVEITLSIHYRKVVEEEEETPAE